MTPLASIAKAHSGSVHQDQMMQFASIAKAHGHNSQHLEVFLTTPALTQLLNGGADPDIKCQVGTRHDRK